MGLKAWIERVLDTGGRKTEQVSVESLFELSADIYIRELAFWTCTNTVARAISKCEFRTFVNGEENKGAEYYLWNIEPNKNQNSSVFLQKLIAKLFRDNEALIVEQGGQLLIADSFSRKPYALYDDIFTNVQIEDFSFNKSFVQSDVMYFTLGEQNIRQIVNGVYESYQKLIAYGMNAYQKSRGSKGILNIDTLKFGNEEDKERFNKMMNEGFRSFMAADNAVMPLFKGYDFKELGSKTYSAEGTRDIRAMIDDVSDFTAKAFGIPPALIRGDVEGTKDALENFLTFCIDPLCDMLQEEINRKRNGADGFAAGTYIQIDTRCIKHVDILSVSNSIDKLISSGAYTINDIRKLTGELPIKEGWADQHFMTKNYTSIQELGDLSSNKNVLS